jgi:uncharacterized damage-inducible protein DinB
MTTLPNSVPTSAADKEKLLSLLQESKERFLGSFAGVNDEDSRRHPAEGRWSILDTVEHLTAAEQTLFKRITETRRPRSETTLNREEVFLCAVADRSRKSESPETARPRGRFADLSEARTQFETARDNTIRFVEQCTEDLRATEATHPHPLAGVVTTYEMLIIMAKHAERHALQIEETRNCLAIEAGSAKGKA